jgi:hypothetical protein
VLVPEFFWQIPINLGLAVVLAVVQVVASIPVLPGHDAVSSVGFLIYTLVFLGPLRIALHVVF